MAEGCEKPAGRHRPEVLRRTAGALGFALALALAAAPHAPLAAQDIEAVGDPIEDALKSGPLLPDEVLRSSALTFPAILESFEREAAARGDRLAADGAFDLMLDARAYDRVSGFYSGGFAEFEATQPLRPFGAKVFGSYRLSDGDFPIYENVFNTNELGEFKVGALLSLLRDSTIDNRRFAVEDTRLAASQARLDILLVQLNVQFEALQAYWTWVAAGNEIRVYEELLEIAEARAVGLNRQVREGALPAIALTENEQNLIRRRSLLEEARRDFLTASNSLSFYLRDTDGNLIVPTREQLPSAEVLNSLPDVTELIADRRRFVIDERPELETLRLAIERAENRVELRRNDLKPRLDFEVELSRDFGPVGDGGPSFDSTDTVVGLTFTVPLQRREARGRLRRAEAELRARELEQRRIADEISVELDNILTNLDAALRLADLADDEVRQATAMVEAERKRFRLGAGDFFLVNLREERAADAQIRAIQADLIGRLATASYNAATMHLDELGLE
ncbi:TolC family protein [Erythrobacter sp. HL-111]|uniref:TolC family protein n=1 Tax=Erythrobacter sp. HL-111 TaxID=1798193 RepID=UPI0006DBBE46|nr:TolC family protein [Erythrobacter sp. HL-111]KPP93869.1 MAG: Outer membrane protein [Erythrobacteraceae bacterium HL-111]SDS36405.1 Outer membrane efflux protein [Erythrobacter sp. HL-111]